MPERYKPKTESERRAFMLGEIVGAAQFELHGHSINRVGWEYWRNYSDETKYYINLSYPNGDQSVTQIDVNRQWEDQDPDSGADSQQVTTYEIRGHDITKKGFVDYSHVNGRFMKFTNDQEEKKAFKRRGFEVYMAPEVGQTELELLWKIINGIGSGKLSVSSFDNILLPSDWPKEK